MTNVLKFVHGKMISVVVYAATYGLGIPECSYKLAEEYQLSCSIVLTIILFASDLSSSLRPLVFSRMLIDVVCQQLPRPALICCG